MDGPVRPPLTEVTMAMISVESKTLHHNIEQDIDSCTALLTLLDEERDALKNREIDELERIIRDKAKRLSALENGAKRRSEIVRQLPEAQQSGANQQTLWRHLLEQQAPDVLDEWNKLGELIKQCQRENEINGRLLSRNKQVFSRILSIMRGQTQNENVYTSQGSKGTGHGGHSLGEA